MRKNKLVLFFIFAVLLLQNTSNLHALTLSSITVTSLTNYSAQILWTTDIISDSALMYGTQTQVYTNTSSSRCDGTVPTKNHCIYLTNLTPNTIYYYKVAVPLTTTSNTMPAGGIVSTTSPIVQQENYFRTLAVGLTTTTSPSGAIITTSNGGLVTTANTPLPGTAGSVQLTTVYATPTPSTIQNPVVTTTSSNTANQTTSAVGISFTTVSTTTVPTTTNITTTSQATTTKPVVATPAPVVAIETIPSSPTNATAILTSSGGSGLNSIHIEWIDNSTNETNFRIYRSSPNSSVLLPTIQANETKYDDIHVGPGTYTYYIAACNTLGCSLSVTTIPVTIVGIIPVTSTTTPSISTMTVPLGITTPTIATTIIPTPVLSNEISNALGKGVPGSFINIVPAVTSTISTTTFMATVGKDGSFGINVPDGTYIVEGFVPITSTGTSSLKRIILINGKVTSVTDEIITGSKKLTGFVLYPDSTLVTDATVSAYKKETGEWIDSNTDTSGRYSLSLTTGSWDISVQPTNGTSPLWESTQASIPTVFTDSSLNETRDLTLKVTPLNSKLTVNVTDENGVPLPDVSVTLDTSSSNNPQSLLSPIRNVRTEKTDSHGSLTIQDTPGTYFMRTSILSTLQYLEAPEQKIVLGTNETSVISLILKKENITSLSKITGIVKFDDNTPTDALVSAWSNEGGHEQTQSLSNGTYSLTLTPQQTWHIAAHKDAIQKSYATDEQTILVTSPNQTLDFVFIKNEAIPLPLPITTTQAPTQVATVLVDDGARFTLPANAVSSTGNIAVEVKPTTEAASHSFSTVVSTAYDITVKNTLGKKISQLASEAEILLPYDEQELKAKGVALENVVPSYYDESTSAWTSVTKFTINREKKVFVLKVNHLTRFALIAAADTIAPPSPTGVITDAITPTDVRISWKNPAQDFNHSKIYRSEKLGSFGTVVAAEVFSNSFIDKTNTDKEKTFYYTVRSVDSAGNESTNSTQIAFLSKGSQFAGTNKTTSLLLPPGQVSMSEDSSILDLGSRGDDVLSVQKALKLDGFYTSGPLTGYYGKLTKNAVKRFQNYYKEELLIPNGFKKPTGMVGPATRKKINEILARNTQ